MVQTKIKKIDIEMYDFHIQSGAVYKLLMFMLLFRLITQCGGVLLSRVLKNWVEGDTV